MAGNDLLNAAKREAERLRDELAANSTYQKLQQVQRLIDIYEAGPKPHSYARVSATGAPYASGSMSKTRVIETAAADYLRRKRGRATSGEIMGALEAAGVAVPGKRPSKSLASYLSNSKLFDNVKGEGYGLAEWSAHKAEAPPDKPEGASNLTGEGDTSPVESRGGMFSRHG